MDSKISNNRFKSYAGKINYTIFAVSLLFSLAFLRSIFPYKIPLFTPFAFFLLIISIVVSVVNKESLVIPKNLFMLYIVEALYILAIVFSNKVYSNVSRDVKNIIGLNIFIILFFYFIRKIEDFKKFEKYVLWILFASSVCISLLALYKFFLLSSGIRIGFFISRGKYPWGTSLILDYNSFAFANLAGLIAAVTLFDRMRSSYKRLCIFISSLLIGLNILLSGSRRGFVLLVIILLFYVIKIIVRMIKKLYSLSLEGEKIQKSYSIRSISNVLLMCLLSLFSLIVLQYFISRVDFMSFTETLKIFNRLQRFLFAENTEYAFFSRFSRFAYTLEFINNYKFGEILFGSGFDYLKSYAVKFHGIGEDYPHNIFISSFLYGGFIGLAVILVFFIQVIMKYLKKFSHLKVFFIWFLIYFFFSMTSANSVFSLKNLSLLLVVPFLSIDYPAEKTKMRLVSLAGYGQVNEKN